MTNVIHAPSQATRKRHRFAEKLEKAKRHENALDKLFAPFFDIEAVSVSTEIKHGVDRVFRGAAGIPFTVEYKADSMAKRTGNIFVETWSQWRGEGKRNVRGWAHTCTADVLITYVPGLTIIVTSPGAVRYMLDDWQSRFRRRTAVNENERGKVIYSGVGILVPLDEFRRIAKYEFDCRVKCKLGTLEQQMEGVLMRK